MPISTKPASFSILTWMPTACASTEGSREFMAAGRAGFIPKSSLPAVVQALCMLLADQDPTGILTVTFPKAVAQ